MLSMLLFLYQLDNAQRSTFVTDWSLATDAFKNQAINNNICYSLPLVSKVENIIMNISLNPHFEELVKGKVESGLYNSVSEVMREALRLLEERDQLRDLRLEALRRDIQKGVDSGEATPLDIEDIKSRGRKRLDKASQQMKG